MATLGGRQYQVVVLHGLGQPPLPLPDLIPQIGDLLPSYLHLLCASTIPRGEEVPSGMAACLLCGSSQHKVIYILQQDDLWVASPILAQSLLLVGLPP